MSRNYRLRIPAPCGQLEIVINDPVEGRKGIALIAHPHPQHGGTLDNKVVQTVAKTLAELNYVAVRPNFRGVGLSDGAYDHGEGEVEDMLAAARFARSHFADLPLLLAGFSFGAYVQSRAGRMLGAEKLLLIAPAVNLFDFDEVPPECHVIHGEQDELVPLAAVREWAGARKVEVAVVAGADHFFHRKLSQLRQLIIDSCRY